MAYSYVVLRPRSSEVVVKLAVRLTDNRCDCLGLYPECRNALDDALTEALERNFYRLQ